MVNTQGYRVVDARGDNGPVTLGLQESLDHLFTVAMGAAKEVVKAHYHQRSIHVLFNMERISEGGRVLRVQVIVTSDCVFHAVMHFHSSKSFTTYTHPPHSQFVACVMNVITYNRAISFYPMASFEFRRNQEMAMYGASLSSAESARAAILKYRERGFEPGGYHSAEDSRYGHASYICLISDASRTLYQHGCDRKVGDRWCWTLNLDMSDISPRGWVEDGPWDIAHARDEGAGTSVAELRAQDPIMHNKWRMTGFHFVLSPKYCLLRLPIFKYGYGVVSDIEALWARKFSDDMAVAKRNGVFTDRKW